MTTQDYLNSIHQRYQLGNATEHTFRGDLQNLIESLVPEIRATNEPKRQACGAPDYILTKKDIPVGFIEAKDIGDKDLEGKKKTGNKEQFDRYKASLNNLIFTDYLNFHLYREGELKTKIAIAEFIPSPSGRVGEGQIKALPEKFKEFENLIQDFCIHVGQTITSSKKLAQMMAGKARLLSDVIEKSLLSDEESYEDSTLKEQMVAFKNILIHDITPKGFADVYAQTITYGMFAARLHDPTLETFSRQEAATLIPKTNPFLRKLFGYIAGIDIDDRILWIVEDLVEIFLASDVEKLLQDYGKKFTSPSGGGQEGADPIIHFYEDFLAEYDPKLRKSRGVWYTPAPVVSFIVRAVDDILKTEFGLAQGLADTSKTKIKVNTQIPDKRSSTGFKQEEKEVHKVQILDPATGTGTFLAEVVKHIHKKFQGQEGIWSGYVEKDLIPRLNGFELLMASYAMAHLQLDLLLTKTGYKPTGSQRLRIFLTNSLEEYHPDTGTLFASWLSAEANEANHIKRDTPVMCILGNPPYAVSSTNKSDWIEKLILDYKKELKEKNIQPLSDDYIKFIRYGQYFIEKNGSGILAYIANNSFLDGIIHRQMRKHLLENFDSIYILDLHGNAKKKETTPKGETDQNVFDIQQGVSINIFVKTEKDKKELAQVFHDDLFGKRNEKNQTLNKNNLNTIPWKKLKVKAPYYFFVPKDFVEQEKYEQGFAIHEIFENYSSGIKTHNDKDLVSFSSFLSKETQKYDYRPFDVRFIDYHLDKVERHRFNLMQHILADNIVLTTCRQQSTFDFQHVFLSKYLVDMCQVSLQTKETTYAFPLYFYQDLPEIRKLHLTARQVQVMQYRLLEAEKTFKQHEKFFNQTIKPFFEAIENPSQNEIKLFEENQATYEELKANIDSLKTQLSGKSKAATLFDEDEPTRIPNLDKTIVAEIAQKLNLTFTPEKHDSKYGQQSVSTFAPIDILDYIYAVLHSPSYREKYKEFLKIDFPRVPYPAPPQPSPKEREKAREKFWKLVKLGGELRQIHLLESPKVEEYITSYPKSGTNEITTKIAKKDWEIIDNKGISPLVLGRIWLNEEQYFDHIPLVAWEFYIGGYQPAQKWLKDRRGRTLDFEDILHYQKIIVALTETDRLMKEIDKIKID